MKKEYYRAQGFTIKEMAGFWFHFLKYAVPAGLIIYYYPWWF